MRFLPGLLLLLPLASPFGPCRTDDVFDRGNCASQWKPTPRSFNFKEGDKLTGFEVELGELLAKEMDVRPPLLPSMPPWELLPGVESAKYDVAINHIATELADRFDFSEPYSYPAHS